MFTIIKYSAAIIPSILVGLLIGRTNSLTSNHANEVPRAQNITTEFCKYTKAVESINLSIALDELNHHESKEGLNLLIDELLYSPVLYLNDEPIDEVPSEGDSKYSTKVRAAIEQLKRSRPNLMSHVDTEEIVKKYESIRLSTQAKKSKKH